jgi:site-specific recombinase XerD
VYAKVTSVPDVTEGLPRPSYKSERPYWISRRDVLRLIHELVELGHSDAAVYCAILHGTALDTTDVARLTASQIERSADLWLVYSTSDKAERRDRRTTIHRFVHPFICAHIDRRIAEAGPDALLFPGWANQVNARDPYSRAHNDARASLVRKKFAVFARYEPRDSRHSLAVAMAQQGNSVRMIAHQLGTSEELVSSTYAKWLVSRQELIEVQERMEQQHVPVGGDWDGVSAQMDGPRLPKSDASRNALGALRGAFGTRQRRTRRTTKGGLRLLP